MDTILAAGAVGFGLGLAGTAGGGLLVLVRRRPSPLWQARLLGVAGGIMLAVSFFDLWPGAWRAGGFLPTGYGTAAGVLLVGLLDFFLPPRPAARFVRAGLLLGLGIGAHNFPEGVALGTAFTARGRLGGWLDLGLLMALHNIPEGMVMAASLRLGGYGPARILLALALVELPMAVGGGIGGFFGRLSPAMVAGSLAFAAGAMVLVVVRELLPAGEEVAGRRTAWGGTAMGLIFGTILTRLF
ncbi:MAG: ZIP family metal transporter [Bacillota bacterium]